MNNVNYKTLKSNIIKACKQSSKGTMKFIVDLDKLTTQVESMELIPLNLGMESKLVKPENIPYLSEYFEKSNLSWFSDSKYFTALCFIDKESVDETAQELIDQLNISTIEDPDLDHVSIASKLIADYPCYFATVVSYQNNDPKLYGKASYEIICRANKVVIKSSDYQYNPKDFS